MNKELIKKYKAEFEHWLNGGSVLLQAGYVGDYHEVPKNTTWCIDGNYIINDQYMKFRRALTEGKIVEYFIQGQWEPTKKIYNHSLDCSQHYRIKPENEAKEITIDEIENLLGYKVKIVKN